jgi:beta-glucanase (GH16 family)
MTYQIKEKGSEQNVPNAEGGRPSAEYLAIGDCQLAVRPIVALPPHSALSPDGGAGDEAGRQHSFFFARNGGAGDEAGRRRSFTLAPIGGEGARRAGEGARSSTVSAILAIATLLLFSAESRADNILTNAGFETPALASWTTFGVNGSSVTDPATAHSGNNYYKAFGQSNGANNYTGVYQTIPASAGATFSADGWVYSIDTDGGLQGQDQLWLEVSFRDAANNAIALFRSDTVTAANIGNYGGLNNWFDLSITNQCYFTNANKLILYPGTITNTVTSLVAPANTAYVRYQLVFAQGSDNAAGTAFFDDLNLNQTGGPVYTPPVPPSWNIVWSDEFNGSTIDSTKWTFDVGTGPPYPGWGNNELEYYTGRATNAYVSGGSLHIRAQLEAFNGQNYTSAKIKTAGKFSKLYGRFEWRAKLPTGTGFWPALWMLPQSSPYGGWPNSGEIDVVENKGNVPNQEGATIHYGGQSGNDIYSGATYTFPSGDSVTNFHTYLCEWTTNKISFSVDGHLFETQTNWWSNIGTSTSKYPYPAPFDQPFYIVMNLAVGGNYLGNPPTNSINPSMPGEMLIDYVRVYDQTAPLQISMTQSNGTLVLSWPANIVCHLQAQTNSPAGDWSDVSGATNPYLVTPDPGNAGVYYRLQSP